MHGAVLKSYQINPSDFISQRAPTITEGTDSSHLFIGVLLKNMERPIRVKRGCWGRDVIHNFEKRKGS